MGAITLNFRKLRQDFSNGVLKEGKQLYDQETVVDTKILDLDTDHIRVNGRVLGTFDNSYDCEIEIDRMESETIHTNCNCSHQYDCQHLAAVLYHLECNLEKIVVDFSHEADLTAADSEDAEELMETFREAKEKLTRKVDAAYQTELLQEYVTAAATLGKSPFFRPERKGEPDSAELAVMLLPFEEQQSETIEFVLSLRLPFRSKPLSIPDMGAFLDAVRYQEPLDVGGRRYRFTQRSFDEVDAQVLRMLLDHAEPVLDQGSDEPPRSGRMRREVFGNLLSRIHDVLSSKGRLGDDDEEMPELAGFYVGGFEQPLCYSQKQAELRFEVEVLEHPAPKVFLHPKLFLHGEREVKLEEALVFDGVRPGVIVEGCYYRFPRTVKRAHLRDLDAIQDMIVPEPLLGTFIEGALPELQRYADVSNLRALDRFVTLPYVGEVTAQCRIGYLDGELDASLRFIYDGVAIPAASAQVELEHITQFTTDAGVIERNLLAESRITEDLFQGFTFDEQQGVWCAKTEKKIVEFMTEVIPKYRDRVDFDCPRNLLDRFIYDKTSFALSFDKGENVDSYEVEVKVNGDLKGLSLDQVWECIAGNKAYIDLEPRKPQKRGRRAKGKGGATLRKILVLDLERLAPVVQIFDEIGITQLDDHTERRPLWSLAGVNEELFRDLPIDFSISKELKAVRAQILGEGKWKAKPIPKEINATLRCYQEEGVQWLDRLRGMHLSGVLADDMGLGKTLQAITAITQAKQEDPDCLNLVVCPTSLIYNWKEEFSKFNKKLNVLPIDGTPTQRKKLLKQMDTQDVLITSYTLLQKDIEIYKKHKFAYVILDEAQHIKNRTTRNAKSVKMIDGRHRLILTGTPIENSLDELWSLFDFLMPGLLSSYERFVEKYIRPQKSGNKEPLEALRKKVAPFILRRMKADVLKDLPPVSEILYHCHLSDVQRELYRSYAKSAREELSKLVKKEGFDKVQIHVLATLTRLKQICCHPAIFAKEEAEAGDSAKYDMFLELMQTLIDGQHKTVVFSQYTRMLKIMRDDLDKRGIQYHYLDGSSKNRLDIVNQFNQDEKIPVFLASLKAGGAGLNLAGADTVVHYDRWWNPAVEQQATDRVHRMGQTRNVSSINFVTLGTIEEKIADLQERKKGLVKQVVGGDDEVISKLTWDEVLELLQI